MEAQDVQQDRPGSKVDLVKGLIQDKLNYESCETYVETYEKALSLGIDAPEQDILSAVAELRDVPQETVDILLKCKGDPELTKGVKSLLKDLIEIDEKEPGAGKDFLKFLTGLQEANHG